MVGLHAAAAQRSYRVLTGWGTLDLEPFGREFQQ